ncbi:MAG TPA: helicase-associated domain-containing protein [Bryobacteraceae bacterium]
MKILDIDWHAFLQVLESYRRLPYGARRFILEKVQPSQPVSNLMMGQWREVLLESGLMVAGVKGKNAHTDPRFQAWSRVLRALHRNRIFQAPSRDAFSDFLSEHLEGPEIAAFSGAGAQYYYYQDYAAVQAVFARTCSTDWVKEFLAARGAKWEARYQAPGRSPYFSSDAVVKAAQLLIQKLVPGAVPVPMAQLQGMCPELHHDTLAAAIRGAVRYLLLFPCLQGEGLEPALGLWPAAARKLSNDIPRKPTPIAVSDEFHSAFLLDDMTAVLTACVVEPPRVRVNDFEIFEADRRNLVAALGTLPEWAERELRIAPGRRIDAAFGLLRDHGFVKQKNDRGRDVRIEITEAGSGWLRLAGKERLKTVLDGLRTPPDHDSALLSPPQETAVAVPHLKQMAAAFLAAFAASETEVFVRLRDFLAYYRDQDNPLKDIARQDRQSGIRFAGRYYGEPPSEDELEEQWEQALDAFLRCRLLPLGGVKVGKDRGGELCFALTGSGRYLLGGAADFPFGEEAAGRIVLQPNCDVVFLAPSAKAESDIARFCERKGRHVGTLFKVTKASILAAAAAGLTADQILSTLREYCSSELPPNVEREITGWFRQYRQVAVVPALLIHCPDAETATRVISVAGRHVTRLTDTTLEWHDQKPQAALVKKLREMGIFVRS